MRLKDKIICVWNELLDFVDHIVETPVFSHLEYERGLQF